MAAEREPEKIKELKKNTEDGPLTEKELGGVAGGLSILRDDPDPTPSPSPTPAPTPTRQHMTDDGSGTDQGDD